jgi:hypothetical protein
MSKLAMLALRLRGQMLLWVHPPAGSGQGLLIHMLCCCAQVCVGHGCEGGMSHIGHIWLATLQAMLEGG